MRFLVDIDETVYGQVDISPEWLEQAINCELDDAYSQHIKVEELVPAGRETAKFLLTLP